MGGWLRATPRPHYRRKRDPVPIVQNVVWPSGPVRTGAKNLAPTGIRSPYRPARRKHYSDWAIPAHVLSMYITNRPFFCYTQYKIIYTNMHGFRWFKCLTYWRYELLGGRGGTVVKVLCYKSEGRWFDPSWCQWIFHWHKILPIALWPCGRLSL